MPVNHDNVIPLQLNVATVVLGERVSSAVQYSTYRYISVSLALELAKDMDAFGNI